MIWCEACGFNLTPEVESIRVWLSEVHIIGNVQKPNLCEGIRPGILSLVKNERDRRRSDTFVV